MTIYTVDASLSQVFNTNIYTATKLAPIPYNLNFNRVSRAHGTDRVYCNQSAPPASLVDPHHDWYLCLSLSLVFSFSHRYISLSLSPVSVPLSPVVLSNLPSLSLSRYFF